MPLVRAGYGLLLECQRLFYSQQREATDRGPGRQIKAGRGLAAGHLDQPGDDARYKAAKEVTAKKP